jgi:hypothetical protein
MPSMKPRRWKISKTVYDYSNETRWDGPGLADDETVEVIEFEPLLDLLEQAEAAGVTTHVVHALLGEHGRGMEFSIEAVEEFDPAKTHAEVTNIRDSPSQTLPLGKAVTDIPAGADVAVDLRTGRVTLSQPDE